VRARKLRRLLAVLEGVEYGTFPGHAPGKTVMRTAVIFDRNEINCLSALLREKLTSAEKRKANADDPG
jgi:hypothetical protein